MSLIGESSAVWWVSVSSIGGVFSVAEVSSMWFFCEEVRPVE